MYAFNKQSMPRSNKVMVILLVVAALAQGVNMFGFPAYREDEGTYMSQAWSIINLQSLAPYTYWYDHAPVGWIIIALWSLFTGGFFVAGLSVNSGRILMFVVQIISTFLVYKITLTISRRRSAAAVAALLFSLSPLGIIFHRRVLLDNIMVVLFLVSNYILIKHTRLKYMILSAWAFAFAVLAKESAILFLPAMILFVQYSAHKNTKLFSEVCWVSVAFLTLSIYPLFAFLKGELFPSGTLLGGTTSHVSLWGALAFQYGRRLPPFTSAEESFLFALRTTWLEYGMIFLFAGLLATIVNIFYRKDKRAWAMALLSFMYVVIMVRGQVLDWYIIPLIPLFAINVALLYGRILDYFDGPQYKLRFVISCGLSLVVAAILAVDLLPKFYVFTLDQTQNQVQAVDWVKNKIDKQSVVLIDNYAFVDLNPKLEKIDDARIHYYWKADTDPQVKDEVLQDNWNEIDYLLFTPAVKRSIDIDDLYLVEQAYKNSHVVKRFDAFDVGNEGYPVEIREVNNENGVVAKSWEWYKESFITPEGRVLDRIARDETTSEAQSYALLRAVWREDRETFDTVWQWTDSHMRQPDSYLFSWLYGKRTNTEYGITDQNSATDADEDIALALIFAYKIWNDEKYLDEAKLILTDMWNKEIVSLGDTLVVLSGTGAKKVNTYLVNPSYFSPASYRIFAEIDWAHNWQKVADDSYKIIDKILSTKTNGKNDFLVPNWVVMNGAGEIQKNKKIADDGNTTYGYDAFRLLWRVALDYVWNDSADALAVMNESYPFFKREWSANNTIYAEYSTSGESQTNYSDVSTEVGALSVFYVIDPTLAIDMYSSHFWPSFTNGYWNDKKNYYDQNWAWFGTALYTNNLPNIWKGGDGLAMMSPQ